MAIEKDPQLCRELQDRFRDMPNVEIHQGDALKLDMPDEPHKVFANPPFAIEGKLVRKLVNGKKIEHKLKDYFSYDELDRLAQEYGFHVNDRPTDLTFNQWLGIFGALKKK